MSEARHAGWRPALRPVQVLRVPGEGEEETYAVRDGTCLDGGVVFVRRPVLALLALMDGTRTVVELAREFWAVTGVSVEASEVEALVRELDDALLLEGGKFAAALDQRTAQYRARRTRRAYHAGDSYPEEPTALARVLDQFLARAPGGEPRGGRVVGAFVPHIDFARGGDAYAAAYRVLAEQPQVPNLVVILGVDHSGPLQEPYVATSLDFETPFGRVETDREALGLLERESGVDLLAGELAHEREHSVEFQLVWLQHVWRGHTFRILPILCSTLGQEAETGRSPMRDTQMRAVMDGLLALLADRRGDVLVLAAGDLSHVGPAFGDEPVSQRDLQTLAQLDRRWLETLARCDAESLFQDAARDLGARKICGLGAGYTLAWLMRGRAEGLVAAYRQCPADEEGSSFVSVGTVLLWETETTQGGES